MEMEKFTVLFAVGRMEDRVQVVARSRSDAIDVGRICAELGGGGHAYAASASIRNLTLNEVHDAIVRNLHMQAGPEKDRQRLYVVPRRWGSKSDRSMREADTLMMHFGLKAVPVFRPGTRHCIGILDAQTASRATSHKLGERPVDDYMRRNIKTLAPDAPLAGHLVHHRGRPPASGAHRGQGTGGGGGDPHGPHQRHDLRNPVRSWTIRRTARASAMWPSCCATACPRGCAICWSWRAVWDSG